MCYVSRCNRLKIDVECAWSRAVRVSFYTITNISRSICLRRVECARLPHLLQVACPPRFDTSSRLLLLRQFNAASPSVVPVEVESRLCRMKDCSAIITRCLRFLRTLCCRPFSMTKNSQQRCTSKGPQHAPRLNQSTRSLPLGQEMCMCTHVILRDSISSFTPKRRMSFFVRLYDASFHTWSTDIPFGSNLALFERIARAAERNAVSAQPASSILFA